MQHKILLSSVLLALVAAPAASSAQGVSLTSEYTDFTTWNVFGSAKAVNTTPGNGFTYSDLQLTFPGVDDSAGAGFAPNTITLDFNQAFSFDFNFFIPTFGGVRGDGLTFTLTDVAGVGTGGSGLGYEGLSNSLAFAVDTFNFDGEPKSPSIQILQNGDVTPLAYTETGLGDSIRDINYQWRATFSYTPSGLDDEKGDLTGTIYHANLGSFSVTASAVDLSNLGTAVAGGHQLYYGFTAGNGLADDGHFVTSAAPVPVPAAFWLFGSAILGLVGFNRRKQI
ncbi:lectin-like domain-containing protein [Methylomonas sp. 2BW1-5-20]|uniref:lectin-like domain-containing protein n=1 Tax=Methylomonas sp. 2BW1-5-20 TaxID=3376686 RepID=UPI0040528F79